MAPQAPAVDVSGQWVGTSQGPDWRSPITLTLTQTGNEVAGTVIADAVPGGFDVTLSAAISATTLSGSITHVRRGRLQLDANVSGSTMSGTVDGISFAASRARK
jgi:hypothetical protein